MTFLILLKSPKAKLVFNHHIKILTDLKNKYYTAQVRKYLFCSKANP